MLYLSLGEGNPVGEELIFKVNAPFPLRLRLEGGNGMEWKGIKIIILEYSSLLLFRSFNGGN